MAPVTLDRLRDGRDVAAVLRGRRQRAGRLVVVHARTRQDEATGPCRIAVVASRRIGNAVTRNRAKRLMREASREVSWSPGLDVVLVARAAAAHRRSGEVTEELRQLADDLGLVEPAAGELATNGARS